MARLLFPLQLLVMDITRILGMYIQRTYEFMGTRDYKKYIGTYTKGREIQKKESLRTKCFRSTLYVEEQKARR